MYEPGMCAVDIVRSVEFQFSDREHLNSNRNSFAPIRDPLFCVSQVI